MKEIKDLFSLVGGPLKASTKSHILASTNDIYDEFWGTYLNVINEYNSNPLDAFLVQNKGIITEIIDSTKIQTLTKTTLNVGDLCLGIYKDDTLTNSKYDYSEGEYLIPGYKSVYFTISEISNEHITVTAEKDEIKPNTIFVVIGNNKNGINFSLNTEDLKADFINVKAFKIEEGNIKNISGKFKYNGVECVGTLLNKIYTSNSIGYLNNAPSLNSAFKSNVFTRTNTTPGKPSPDVIEVNGIKYNTYDNPIPGDVNDKNELIWSDGIPEGNAALWASTRIFSSDGKYPLLEVWTTPKQMTDMADFAVAFSSVEDNPGDPANNKDNWASTADESTIWMATSTCKNGEWSAWQISKIKGEKGNDGTSISILGSARKVDVLPTELSTDKALLFTNHLYEGKTHPWIYLWNKTLWEAYSGNAGESYLVDGNLYVWDGDSWENVGSFKGDKGESAYIHIKYAKQDDGGEEVTLVDGSTIKLSFTDSNGEVPGLYLGLKPDHESKDSNNITDYTWAKWKGEDGFGYEYIYIGTEEYKNPGVPESKSYNGKSPNDDDYVPEGWSDNPVEINSKVKYCWMCHRQKVDGKWSNYKGVDDTWASLWAKWSEDGNGIVKITRRYLITAATDENGNDITIEKIKELYGPTNAAWQLNSPAVNSEKPLLVEWIHTEYTSGDKKNDYAIIGRMGDPGIDGSLIEYIYILTKTIDETISVPEENSPSINTNELGKWTDDPQSVSKEHPYQWISEREFDRTQNKWGNYSKPVLWSIWSKGENSVHLDLDNEMDSFLYDGNGNLLSNIITTTPTLYDGLKPVTEGITWEVSAPDSEKNTNEDTFYSFDDKSGILTVNKMSAAENTVVYSITATYKDAKYVSSLTIKKLVGVDKYDLVVTPNSITYNTSIGDESASTKSVNIQVYRTSQGEGRKLITNLNSYKPIEIHVDGTDISAEYLEDGYTFTPDYTKSSIEIDLIKDGIVVDTETIPINKSKDGDNGINGSNAIRLDLDNENDSMLYDGSNNCISGNVISNVSLYDGTEVVEIDKYDLNITPTNCTAVRNGNTITVSAMSSDSDTANVKVTAVYNDKEYNTQLNIKKLIGIDKFELSVTPNSITYNTSTAESSSSDLYIGIYRTSQSEGRKLVTNTSIYGLKLYLNDSTTSGISAYNSANATNETGISKYKYTIDSDYLQKNNDVKFTLTDSNGVVLDSETIPINKSKDGSNSVSIIPSPRDIVAKKSTSDVMYTVDVSVMDGANLVENTNWSIVNTYYDTSSKWYTVAITNNLGQPACPGDPLVSNLTYDKLTEPNPTTRTINLKLAANASVETYFSFDIKYNDVIYNQKIDFKTLADGDNGNNAVTYEIVPDISYFTKATDNSSASGRIGGFVYKIDGNSRTRITSTTLVQYPWGNVASGKLYIAAGYCDDNGNFSFIHNPLVDSGKEDASKNGRFDTGSYFTDITTATTDNNKKGVLSSNSITLELRDSKNAVLASFNVSAAKNGMAGAAGKQAAPLRVSEWAEGTTYYTGYEENAPWSDVVYTNSNGKPVYYRCIKYNNTHDKDLNIIEPTNILYWTKFDGQFESVATGLLLAENAYVNLLSGNTINIKDSSGNTTAGMSGGDGVQLWAGGQQDTANFRVEKDGDVRIKGVITATALYRGFVRILPIVDLFNVHEPYYLGMNVSNPITQDFIVIKTNEYWPTIYDEFVNVQLKQSELYLFIPNPEDYPGKEMVFRNSLATSSDEDKYVNLRITTPDGNADSTGGKFMLLTGYSGTHIDTISGNNKYLETLRLISDGEYWWVFEEFYID